MKSLDKMLNRVLNEDALPGIGKLPDGSLDLVVTDPPYCLGKDYGNDSDKLDPEAYLEWSKLWIDAVIPKLKTTGSLYVFLTWRYSPEIFCYLKKRLIMLNEIIWDRKVPSMGGSTRRYSSVHDNIGFFAKAKDHYFDIDSIRIPYDEETKKARSRSIFVGKKWLEVGYNPKDVWSVSRLHAIHAERVEHPTQKPLEIIERMIKASCPPGGVVFDPFMGSGTTALAAYRLKRNFIGFEINPNYCHVIQERLREEGSLTLEDASALAATSDKDSKSKSKQPTLFEHALAAAGKRAESV
ncbi:MAG: site-specific DNA-methyltransferase [Verrucomicrobia bacterium]|nr:site-specific DNA-methyltransferase [Verrucomicrobiota bacterium]